MWALGNNIIHRKQAQEGKGREGRGVGLQQNQAKKVFGVQGCGLEWVRRHTLYSLT